MNITALGIGQNYESKTWYIYLSYKDVDGKSNQQYIEDQIPNELAAQIKAQKIMADVEHFINYKDTNAQLTTT